MLGASAQLFTFTSFLNIPHRLPLPSENDRRAAEGAPPFLRAIGARGVLDELTGSWWGATPRDGIRSTRPRHKWIVVFYFSMFACLRITESLIHGDLDRCVQQSLRRPPDRGLLAWPFLRLNSAVLRGIWQWRLASFMPLVVITVRAGRLTTEVEPPVGRVREGFTLGCHSGICQLCMIR